MRPLVNDTLTLTNLKDRRVLVFWLLEIIAIIQFLLWLILASKVAAVPIYFNPLAASISSEPKLSSPLRATISKHIDHARKVNVERSLQQISIDIWFGLCFTVVMDAFAVVLTFNRALIRKFHNVVSQRLIFLASIILCAIWSWNAKKSGLCSRHALLLLAGGFTLYGLLGYILDKLEKRDISPGEAIRRGTFAQYSKDLGRFETSWTHAAFLAAIIGGLGLFLTSLVPPPWSAGLPVIHILLESLVLSMRGTKRSPRYISLSSPLFFAVVCVHWGVMPLSKNPRLSITPSYFLGLVLLSRFLLDAHLLTILRLRSELKWSRKNILISTPRLLAMCFVMLFLENLGVMVITYIKPLSVLVFFGLGIAGYMGAAAYDIAAKLTYIGV
ncbi:hypothetical protein PEBR_35493 [Penicillium brasilianum]|uniref:Uncharacterized protein n=1 Tax=Penicillium brasilianum TaxID=104259 RepID=A0A1S9RER4_PENBI|nr:hypothetical protein PEBR_35493 [Penicillium brasilianum]